jgi:hypothetical protein
MGMRKIINQMNIGKYAALELSDDLPMNSYTKYRIAGKIYNIVPVYDLPRHIAIEAQGDFVGKTVEFIK